MMFRTPRKLLQAAMDSEEFAELLAYETYFEPMGEQRADLRAALVAASNGSGRIADYRLKFRPPFQSDRNPDDVSARMKAYFAARRKQP